MGAFQEYISTQQLRGVGLAIRGWIFSLYAFMAFGVRLFVGPLSDEYGPSWLALSGSILVILSMDLIGNCTGQ
jgi:MFS family permease